MGRFPHLWDDILSEGEVKMLVKGFAIKSAASFKKYGSRFSGPAGFLESSKRRALQTSSTEKTK